MQPTPAGLSLTNNSAAHSVIQRPHSQSASAVDSTPPRILTRALSVGDLPSQTPLQKRVTTPIQAAAKPTSVIPIHNGIKPEVPWGQGVSAGTAEEALKVIFRLPNITDLETIGSGATADVKKITINSENFAVKISKEESGTLKARHKHSFTIEKGEICGLNIPPHPCIMRTCALLLLDEKTKEYHLISNLKDLPQSGHDKYSVRACIQELLEGKDLFDCLYTDFTLEPGEGTAIAIGVQVAEALQHLHKHGFIYRDIKPENMFYNLKSKQVKLVDYGLLKHVPVGHTTKTFCGTPDYKSPEVILHEHYDHTSDSFAFGLLLYELATGDSLFCKYNNHNKKYKKIVAFSEKDHKQRKTKLVKSSLNGFEFEPNSKLVSIISRLTCRAPASRMALSTAIEKLSELQQKRRETQVYLPPQPKQSTF